MKKILFACTVFSLAIFACAKDDTTAADTTEGSIELRLTDGPGMFEAVNIDVIGAEIKTSKDTAKNGGWLPLTVRTGVFNILALSNGVDTLLGATKLPLADIKEIRLMLGTNNTVKVGGVSYPLTIPSGSESGLKLKFEHKLLAGVTYQVKLDFDAAKSIIEEKKGEYKLRPRLRLITVANDGAVRGEIAPVTCKSVVYAISGTDTITSAFPSSLGRFVLQGLDAGTYKIVVDAETCTDKVIEGVKVEVGKSTNLEKINLQ